MIRDIVRALVFVGFLAAACGAQAQAPPAGDPQKPQGAAPASSANPFPEDTSTVPVMPSTGTPALPPGTYDGGGEGSRGTAAMLPGDDTDPVRSPDDAAPAEGSSQTDDSSSSLKNIDSLLPPPDSAEPEKRKRHGTKEKEVQDTHQETAKSDIEVGSYYLDQKNWKAALSRFESAMVLDPEDPEVYWGMAEAERNLGQFAKAREHYEKLLEYDPDGKHGKQARKVLKDPALAATSNPRPGKTAIPPQ